MSTDQRPCVLVVEDEPDMNNLLADILSAFDFEPMQAMDGQQALALLGERRPDIILLDLMLPGISGYEVCRRLKTSRDTCSIPVLILTALEQLPDRRAAYQAGADDYMTKPFVPDALIDRLRACLEEARHAAADAGDAVRLVLEPAGAPEDPKVLNRFATALYNRTDLPPTKIGALRQQVMTVVEAAGVWAAAHGGAPAVRVTMTLDADRFRLVFEPLAEGAAVLLAEYLAPEATVAEALIDAGAVDCTRPQGTCVVVEKVLRPQEE